MNNTTETRAPLTEAQTRYYLERVSSRAQSLKTALLAVENRSKDARLAMLAGQRASSGTQLLGQCVRDADSAYAELSALLELAGMLGVDDDALVSAYTREGN